MSKKVRLWGLDLFRGIAAFAVVILHSDEGLKTSPSGWSEILNFAAFAVPFFLAASFYLTIEKLYDSDRPMHWPTRFTRLLIPYGIWSAFYLSQDLLRYLLKHQSDKILSLLNNWWGLIFLGKSAFHLYFIPLLLMGTLVVIAAEKWLRQRPPLSLSLGLWVGSLVVYQSTRLWLSGVAADPVMAAAIAPAPEQIPAVWQWLKTEWGYVARCLPYITMAMVLNSIQIKERLLKNQFLATVILTGLFIGLNVVQMPLWIDTVHEIAKGVSALLLAIALSKSLPENALIASIGQCSFGIYLMHLFVVDSLWSVIKKIGLGTDQVSTMMLVAIAVIAFGVSWIMVELCSKQKTINKLLFGA